MKKKAIIILADGFEEIEAVTAIDILRRAAIGVNVSGLGSKKVRGSKGLIVVTDNILKNDENSYDACILPGGMPGAENLGKSEKVRNMLLDMNEKQRIIAAICAAPAIVLAPLGLLDDKAATCYPGMEEGFSDSTGYSKDDVVVDGNMITSRGPATALKFAIAIVGSLCGQAIAHKIAGATLQTF